MRITLNRGKTKEEKEAKGVRRNLEIQNIGMIQRIKNIGSKYKSVEEFSMTNQNAKYSSVRSVYRFGFLSNTNNTHGSSSLVNEIKQHCFWR